MNSWKQDRDDYEKNVDEIKILKGSWSESMAMKDQMYIWETDWMAVDWLSWLMTLKWIRSPALTMTGWGLIESKKSNPSQWFDSLVSVLISKPLRTWIWSKEKKSKSKRKEMLKCGMSRTLTATVRWRPRLSFQRVRLGLQRYNRLSIGSWPVWLGWWWGWEGCRTEWWWERGRGSCWVEVWENV